MINFKSQYTHYFKEENKIIKFIMLKVFDIAIVIAMDDEIGK